jgi:hypothetical protein
MVAIRGLIEAASGSEAGRPAQAFAWAGFLLLRITLSPNSAATWIRVMAKGDYDFLCFNFRLGTAEHQPMRMSSAGQTPLGIRFHRDKARDGE